MSRKITLTGLASAIPSAITYTNHYYYATDEEQYYLSDGVTWKEVDFDFSDVSPEAEAVLICGISPSGAINPVKLTEDGAIQTHVSSGEITDISGTVTLAHTSQQVAAANADRKFLYVLNTSNADMYLGIGFTPSIGYGILLHKNGGYFHFDTYVPTQAINIVADGAAKTYTALEG